MQPLHRKHVEQALLQLAHARKSFQLYPPNNPQLRAVLQAVVKSIDAVFDTAPPAAAAPEAVQAEEKPEVSEHTPLPELEPGGLLIPLLPTRNEEEAEEAEAEPEEAAPPPLSSPQLDQIIEFEVGRNHFLYQDQPIGVEFEGVCRFSRALYREGIKRLWMAKGATEAEVQSFVDCTIQHENDGQLGDVIDRLHLRFLGLERLQRMQLDVGPAPPKTVDMLEYLRRERTRRELGEAGYVEGESGTLGASGGGETVVADPNRASVAELVRFFAEIEKGSQEQRDYLFNTLTDPSRLAPTLTYLCDVNKNAGKSEGGPSINVLRNSLHQIAGIIRNLPEDLQRNIVVNIADAIMTSDGGTQDAVIKDSLAPMLGQGGIEDAVVKSLPDEQVAEALGQHIRIHEGTANSVGNFLDEFADDVPRRKIVSKMVSNVLPPSGEAKMEEIVELLEASGGLSFTERTGLPKLSREERQKIRGEQTEMCSSLGLQDEEEQSIRQRVHLLSPRADQQQAVLTTLLLYVTGSLEDLSEQIMRGLRNTIQEAVRAGDFEFLSRVLDLVLGKSRQDVKVDAYSMIKPLLTTASTQDAILKIAGQMQRSDKEKEEYQQMTHVLQALAPQATPVLFQQLQRESERNRRLFLLSLFVEVGEPALDYLVRHVQHRDWYVVRNVAYLLGKLGSPMALPALETVMKHPEARVRLEAVGALRAIRGPRAEELLLDLLSDEEPAVRGMAADALGVMSARHALPLLLDQLEQNPWRLKRQPEFAIPLLRSIGKLGELDSLGNVERFKKRCQGFGTKKRGDLVKACEEAATAIRKRANQAIAAPEEAAVIR